MDLNVLEDLKCSPYVIEHSEAVLKKALHISSKFDANMDLNLDLVKSGAILHDVGRSRTAGIRHAVVGALILKQHGFPRKIIKITERHIGAGISKEEAVLMGLPAKNYLPTSLEEKIVAHADNLIHGTREVSLEFVIRKWKKKMGNDHPSLDRLRKLHQELLSYSGGSKF